MPLANNRAAKRPRSSFQTAGGVTILFSHPFLSGQISDASPVDTLDVSAALRLNETFFNATPAQDSSFQETLVDGSTITITNHLMNGTMTLSVLQTTGFVGTGDFIACAHLIIASKDDVGGTMTVVRNFNGVKRTRVYYGVSFKNVPHEMIAGNSVVPYSVTMLYSGWFEGAGNADLNTKTIWAVGNKYGLKGVYRPYEVQLAENGSTDFYSGRPATGVIDGAPVDVDKANIKSGVVDVDGTYPKVNDSSTVTVAAGEILQDLDAPAGGTP